MTTTYLTYVAAVRRTFDPLQTRNERLANFALGLSNELHEFMLVDGVNSMEDEQCKEYGDVCWYFAALADTLFPGVDMDGWSDNDIVNVRVVQRLVVSQCEHVKKLLFHGAGTWQGGQEQDADHIDSLKELWWVLGHAWERGYGDRVRHLLFSSVLKANIEKLKRRWPDGFVRANKGVASVQESSSRSIRPCTLDLLEQDAIWVGKDGVESNLEDLTPAHRKNLLAWLRRSASGFLDALLLCGPAMGDDAELAWGAEHDDMSETEVQEWIEGEPLVVRLRALVEKDDASTP